MAEHGEQVRLACWLNTRPSPSTWGERLLWTHPANGYQRSKSGASKAAAAGQRRGMPDVMIFEPPPALPGVRGVFVELKHGSGKRSVYQAETQRRLELAGWVGLPEASADEARAWLEGLGY